VISKALELFDAATVGTTYDHYVISLFNDPSKFYSYILYTAGFGVLKCVL